MLTVSQRCNLCTRPPPAPKPQDGPGALQLQAPRRPPISRWRCSHAVNSFLPWQREQQPALTVPESSATSVAEQSLEHPALLTPVEALHDVATRVRGRQPAATPSTSATQPAPIISGSGGGIFFFWQLGVIKYLIQMYDLSAIEFRGASAGALIACLAACQVQPEAALAAAHQLALEYGIWQRPLGLAGVWGGLVRAWLDELLPDDAHVQCSGRVKLVVTEIPRLRLRYLENFETKADLIDACMASAHIPFFLDGCPAAWFQGRPYVDGSLQDFVLWRNSELLTCNGSAFIVDYSQDELLKYDRLDFMKLRGLEEVRQLMSMGYQYAERMEAAGVLDAHFGQYRRMHWPGWLPSQVPSDLSGFLERLASMRTTLEAFRPRLPSLGNVLPWGRGTASDAASAPETVMVE